MQISCTKCGKEHKIPDNAIADKKIFFYCSSCGHKIVVDNRRTFVDKKNINKIAPVITDIFNAVPAAFNSTSILISSIYAMFTLLLSLVFGLLTVKSGLMAKPGLMVFTAGLFGLVIYFFFILLLYYVSKIALFKITNTNREKIDWKFINFDLKEDVVVLLIIYIVFAAALLLLLSPIYFLNTGGIIYSGLTFPVIYSLTVLFFLSAVLMNFVIAVIASDSSFVGETFSDIISFFKIEFLNIPVYFFVIRLITGFIYAVISIIVLIPLAAAGSSLFAVYSAQAKASIVGFAGKILPSLTSAVGSNVSAHVTIGAILLMVFVVMIIIFLWAVYVSLNQTLYVKAVYIMKKNPVRSIDRRAYLIGLILLSFFAGKIFSFIDFIGKLKNIIP